MVNTIVLKFGGSSLSNNKNLKIVANKIINLYNNFVCLIYEVIEQQKLNT